MFCTPEKTQNHAAKKAVYNTYIKTSTPCKNEFTYYNISLSRIDTASSSSGHKIKHKQPLQISQKQYNSPKKKQMRRKIKKKKLIAPILEDSDDEWETEMEELFHEFLPSQKFSPKNNPTCYNLFENSCSPEKTRDATVVYEAQKESPIFHFSRKSGFTSDIIVQRDKLPPMVNLSLVGVQDVTPEQTDEDELTIHHEENVKTYPSALQRKKSPERKPDNYMFHVPFPTATSNLLWDEFVAKYRNDISQYLISPSTPVELTDSTRGLPAIPCKRDPIPRGMRRDRCYWNKALSKWITFYDSEEDGEREIKTFKRNKRKRKRKKKKSTHNTVSQFAQLQVTDIYEQTAESDIDFETENQNNKRLTLQQFRMKQTEQRMNKIKLPSTSLDLDT